MSEVKVEKIKEAIAKCQVGVYSLRPNFAKLQPLTELYVRQTAHHSRFHDRHGAGPYPQTRRQDLNGQQAVRLHPWGVSFSHPLQQKSPLLRLN